MQHNQIRQWWSCSSLKPQSPPPCHASATNSTLLHADKAKASLHIRDPQLWSSWNRGGGEMWIGLTVIVYIAAVLQQLKGVPLIFIHCPSICHTLQILQYRGKSSQTLLHTKTYDCIASQSIQEQSTHWRKASLQCSSIILCLTHLIDYKTASKTRMCFTRSTWNQAKNCQHR